jgi:phage antirepressor YoqD-like protein
MESNQIATIMQQALQTVESLQKAIDELKPLADFGAAVIDDGRYYSFNDAAKSLYEAVKKETGFSLGEKKLFSALRELGILSNCGSNWNQPYQQHIEAGRFVIVKHKTEVGMKSVPKITGKGMAYILPKLVEYYK